MSTPQDVVVVGSGNAGLSAAISAIENGAQSVLVIEKAPEEWEGGNTFFTAGAYRTVFNGLDDILPIVSNVDEDLASKIDMESYSEQNFYDDLKRVTSGRADPGLAKLLVEESRDTVMWLAKHGVQFHLSFNRQVKNYNVYLNEIDRRIK
jgi:succinate dehydrogenase/fumarate reductase flavoprotein subunit